MRQLQLKQNSCWQQLWTMMETEMGAYMRVHDIVEQEGCILIQMGLIWVKTVHGSDRETPPKTGQRHGRRTAKTANSFRVELWMMMVSAILHGFG
jgi:hypothetical protein